MKIANQHVPTVTVLLVTVEAIVASASVYLGAWARFADWVLIEESLDPLLPRAIAFGVLVVTGLAATGLYQPDCKRLSIEAVVARIAGGLGLAAIMHAVAFFLFPIFAQGRGVWALSLGISFVLIVAARIAERRLLSEDVFRRRVLVIGAGKMAAGMLRLRRRTDQRGFRIVAFVRTPGDCELIDDERVIEEPENLIELVQREGVDEVVIAMDDRRQGFPLSQLLECKFSGVDVISVLGFLERESGRVDVALLNPSWIVFARGFTHNASRQLASRALDLFGALVIFLLSWPLMILVACAILLDDGRPIIYRQRRVGLMGRPFDLLKFRSMSTEAEADGQVRWAQVGDSRVTRVGRWIRRTRLDELPQVFNVLKGEMSLVGPRPERPEFVEQLMQKIPYYEHRHCVRPGLTGWAQLKYPYGASEADALEKLRLDLYYVKNGGFLLDLAILLQTAEVVIWQKGSR